MNAQTVKHVIPKLEMRVPLFCTRETDCIRRTSPFCLSSFVVASPRHILGRVVSIEVDRLSAPSLPEMSFWPVFRLQRAPHDKHVIHSRYAFSRNAFCSIGCGTIRKSALPNLPMVVVWTDPDLNRWSLVSLSVKVSGCGIFPSSPQPLVPDSLSGVDFFSPVLPVVSFREFRPESSDITEL